MQDFFKKICKRVQVFLIGRCIYGVKLLEELREGVPGRAFDRKPAVRPPYQKYLGGIQE